MPRLSQLMVRTALLWLALGYSLGGLLLTNKGVPFAAWIWTLRMPHVWMLLVGWLVQFAFGVAFWILPRLDAAGWRGDERPVWLCYAALNGGVLALALRDPLEKAMPTMLIDGLSVSAAVLFLVAVAAFASHAWRRVLPFRNVLRPSASSSNKL